ncbi:hypothetical protein [Phocaeicola sp.]
MKANITYSFIYLLIIFSCFPYVQILPLGTDSQPNALFIALCLFPFCCKWRMKRSLALLLSLAVFSVIVLFLSPLTFGSIRSLINYFSLFFIPYVTYFALKKIGGIPYSLFKNIVYTWFLVGTVQLFIYPDFLSFLIPRGDSAAAMESGRGIVCLAPEPTFYGIVCLLLGMIAYFNFKNFPHINRVYVILGIQLFLYSRSSLAIFVLLASFVLSIFVDLFSSKKKNWMILFAGVILSLAIYILITEYSDFINSYRVGILFTLLIEHPENFLILDASANERFVHIFFPLYGFFQSFGMPHGYESFATFMEECFRMPKFQNLFTDYVLGGTITRIMSGWGSLFYELGIVGLVFPYVIYNLFSGLLTGKEKVILFSLFCLILLNAIPFSNPLIPFFIGNLIYLKDEFQKEKEALPNKCCC